jgi:hypothetical protein
MARDENPPFQRGHTFYDGETIDANNLGGENLEGKEWVFEDVNPTTGIARTGRPVTCRCVRNDSGIALYAKQLVLWNTTTAGEFSKSVDGTARVAYDNCVPVDEYLPSAGVPDNDLFWVVVDGPAVVQGEEAAVATNIVTLGGWVRAATNAATSQEGTTLGGRIGNCGATTATTAFPFLHRIGRALTAAAASTGTGADMLIDVGKW